MKRKVTQMDTLKKVLRYLKAYRFLMALSILFAAITVGLTLYIPILIGTFAFGPLAGLVLTLVTSVVQGLTVSAGSGLYGILMHVIATGVLVAVSGGIYRRNKTRKTAAIGLVCGMAAMAVVMMGANMVITPIFMGVPASAVWDLMPFIVGFNVIKAGINGVVTFVLYKRIANFLRR